MMAQFIPYNYSLSNSLDYAKIKSSVDLTESKILIDKVHSGKIELPKNLSELTDGEGSQFYKLSVDGALSLQIPFGSIENKASREICIQQYEKYKTISDGNQQIRVGIGIRWTVNVKKITAEAKVDSLSGIAASAEFGHVEASIRFEQMGLNSKKITSLIPTITKLDTDTYSLLNLAFEKIKELIHEKGTDVNPVILSVLGEVNKENTEQVYEESLARIWGLRSISKRWTLNESIEKVRGESDLFKNIVKDVYVDIEFGNKEIEIFHLKKKTLSIHFNTDKYY